MKRPNHVVRRLCSLPWAVLLAFVIVHPASAAEEILDYKSVIKVERDASLLVTETIRVRAEGRQIKRGIFRWFPVRYRGRNGTAVRVPFDVIKVLRDGKPEPWFTKSLGDGVAVYAGRKDVLLRPGVYTYTLVFRTNRQIGFFKDYDELYFNAIGHKWLFPIRRATVTVALPKGTGYLNWAAYTGSVGSRNKSYNAGRDAAGNLTFATTYTLYPRQGMTIVVQFPKGAVTPPSGTQKFLWLLQDNLATTLLIIGLIVVGLYFLIVWWRVGRDPRGGAIIPLFAPPKGFSPAACRFVLKMGYDKKSFAAAIVDMAVKGFLKIKQKDKVFTLERTGADKKALSNGERAAANKLFGKSKSIKLKNTNATKISAAVKGLRSSLTDEYESGFFLRNRWQFIIGAILSLLFAGAAGFSLDEDTGGLLFILTVVGAVLVFLAWRGVVQWRAGQRAGPIMFALFVIPGGAFIVFFASLMFDDLPILAMFCFLLLGGINVLFFKIMKAPTREGRQVMDEIEGFRMYLSVGEKERLDLINPPEETPELFEKFLPYALALDVENRWAERFAGVLERAGQTAGDSTYTPIWYFAGRGHSTSLSGLTSTLSSSFANAAASASVAPGSSSGGGGGGFSGGGGGGGGGGGW